MRYADEMATEVQAMSPAMLVDLVNGWGTVPRARADARECPPIAAFIARHAASDAGLTVAGLGRLADRLYPVFAAGGAAERASLVNDLMAKSGARPALGLADGGIRPSWLVPRERDATLAAAAITLHAQLVEHDPERLGTCASARCGDVFVDASPGAHRRFCSVTCQNRERVAAFRRRRHTA
jgi:predicted RNA-binding Zn ribbon-like protein